MYKYTKFDILMYTKDIYLYFFHFNYTQYVINKTESSFCLV